MFRDTRALPIILYFNVNSYAKQAINTAVFVYYICRLLSTLVFRKWYFIFDFIDGRHTHLFFSSSQTFVFCVMHTSFLMRNVLKCIENEWKCSVKNQKPLVFEYNGFILISTCPFLDFICMLVKFLLATDFWAINAIIFSSEKAKNTTNKNRVHEW